MSNKKSYYKSLSNLALISQIGFSMIIPIIGCVWFASFLMKRFDLGVWVLFLFVILGVVTAFMNLYKLAAFSNKDLEKDKKEKEEKQHKKDGE